MFAAKIEISIMSQFLTAYEGGLDAEGHPADTRTQEQCEQLLLLLMKLRKLFPDAKIRGHRNMPGSIPKACPCFDVESEYGFLEK